ncbi:hypothetical protein CVT24_006254 [Panaeolus cyanescens]|uniref:Uncharacterized protein n=1 Tax=Panaeolus cyanescens TaxID=181874 RepID=A0A409VCN6_9AGAR|nr:hypothetical protein CVT24_006254 [Panaeolus cyanescens]
MPHYDPQDDIYMSNSHFLSPSTTSPRKLSSRQTIGPRRSNASLRAPSSLADVMDDDASGGPGRHHSLAHELAVALMPEPSAGSKLLAEEFGIEYDESTEGIDDVATLDSQPNGVGITVSDSDALSFADELGVSASDASFGDIPSLSEPDESSQDPAFDPTFNTHSTSRQMPRPPVPEQDAMEVLAQDLESTDKFLNHLRSIDIAEPGSATSQPLEKLASEIIRRMNESIRNRESQVRELLECEREFRKIAGEVGGSEVLGQLEELEPVEDLTDALPSQEVPKSTTKHLSAIVEESRSPVRSHFSHNNSDWELDPDKNHLGDDDYASEPATSPIKDSFPPPPPLHGPVTPASAIPHFNHIRTFTTSLVSSLSTISEQAQVNGAATTEAGRKIRALKNKLGGWRTDWDSAERSRLRIERWEAGIVESDRAAPSSPLPASKRINGRELVKEHLAAFELALEDAALKTQAIMAR